MKLWKGLKEVYKGLETLMESRIPDVDLASVEVCLSQIPGYFRCYISEFNKRSEADESMLRAGAWELINTRRLHSSGSLQMCPRLTQVLQAADYLQYFYIIFKREGPDKEMHWEKQTIIADVYALNIRQQLSTNIFVRVKLIMLEAGEFGAYIWFLNRLTINCCEWLSFLTMQNPQVFPEL